MQESEKLGAVGLGELGGLPHPAILSPSLPDPVGLQVASEVLTVLPYCLSACCLLEV